MNTDRFLTPRKISKFEFMRGKFTIEAREVKICSDSEVGKIEKFEI